MFSFLLTLFDRLKENGINLSINEKEDIFYSLIKTDLSNKNRFKYAIVSNSAHNLVDKEKIELIIKEMGYPPKNLDANIKDLAHRLSNDINARKGFAKAIINNRNLFRLFLNLKNRATLLNNEEFLSRLYDALVYEEKESEFIDFINKNTFNNIDLKNILEEIFRSYPENINSEKSVLKSGQPKSDIRFLDFNNINNKDLTLLQQSIRDAATRLTRKILQSHRAEHSGILNIHKTLRKNTAYENIPFKILHRKKRLKKRDIIILCDMSQSVRNSAFIMITFLNEFSRIFRKVRSFAFVSDITEITSLVSKRDLHNVINSLLSGGLSNLFGNSNYSISFYKFYKVYRGILDKNSIVIIIGDGRNNYNDPNLIDLKNIKKKVSKLYWFVPEPRELWGKGDSQLPLYLTMSDRAFTTTNIAQLCNAVMKISR